MHSPLSGFTQASARGALPFGAPAAVLFDCPQISCDESNISPFFFGHNEFFGIFARAKILTVKFSAALIGGVVIESPFGAMLALNFPLVQRQHRESLSFVNRGLSCQERESQGLH
jgi:hypothetical protein